MGIDVAISIARILKQDGTIAGHSQLPKRFF